MANIFHDTFFAYTLRAVAGTGTLAHPEEKNPSSWLDMVHTEKKQDVDVEVRVQDDVEATGSIGSAGPKPDTPMQSAYSSHSHIRLAAAKGVKYAEKANEVIVVDWCGPDDPAVSVFHRQSCHIS